MSIGGCALASASTGWWWCIDASVFFGIDGAESIDVVLVKFSFFGFAGLSTIEHGGISFCGVVESQDVSYFVGHDVLEVHCGAIADGFSVEAESEANIVHFHVECEESSIGFLVDGACDGDDLCVVFPFFGLEEQDILVGGEIVGIESEFCAGREALVGETKACAIGFGPRFEAGAQDVKDGFFGQVGGPCIVEMEGDGKIGPKECFAVFAC